MSRAQLINMARHNIGHAKAGTIEQAPDIVKVPVQNYFDPDRWQLEMDRIFRRMPLVLAMTDELRNPGDYKAMEAVGMPVLLSRGEDGEVRAFVNMCRHRGSQVMLPGCGNAHRFTCPYHAWTYDQEGALVGVYAPKDFGDVDKGENGLVPLPVAERAGMIHRQSPGDPGHRHLPVRIRRAARALSLRGLASLRAAHDRRPQLEDRLRRLHGPLPPADPAQGHVR
jgi:nitrite reductase/ring-hydroxylating ferredoxin subunit